MTADTPPAPEPPAHPDAVRTGAPQDHGVPGGPAALAELDAATERLLAGVDALDALPQGGDAALAEPSRLPGWTRGHVLAHLARNADGFTALVRWARTGREEPMYPGGREGRDAAIEQGAGRPLHELREDLRSGAERLRAALAELAGDGPEVLRRRLRLASGTELTAADIPLVRVREIELHHVDLAADYTPAHWSPAFTERTLDQLVPFFREHRDVPVAVLRGTLTGRTWPIGEGPELSGQEMALLAWLIGRSDGDGLSVDGGAGHVPPAPPWV